MLTFHILNVEHGLSVVIEYQRDGISSYAVVDSNARAGETPKALTKLRELGAQSLSFLGLTHPHRDHFSGLFPIIQSFRRRIGYFYSFPMGDLLTHRTRLKALGRKLLHLSRTDSPEIRNAALELVQIIKWADSKEADWQECTGDLNAIAPSGFEGVDISTILPPRRVKSRYIEKIERQDLTVLGDIEDNELSFALEFNYAGKKFVIGGDGTRGNWYARRKFENNRNQTVAAALVNLPHHGSKYDCPPDVLSGLFSKDGERAAFTSANGLSHPDHEVILWLEANGVLPYCTNLIPACGATLYQLHQLQFPDVEPTLARWLREVREPRASAQACQGNITIRILPAGRHEIETETGNTCGYRGDYAPLLAL
jgi:beta-lactamase superfamily II metal-dependent hydrolase